MEVTTEIKITFSTEEGIMIKLPLKYVRLRAEKWSPVEEDRR